MSINRGKKNLKSRAYQLLKVCAFSTEDERQIFAKQLAQALERLRVLKIQLGYQEVQEALSTQEWLEEDTELTELIRQLTKRFRLLFLNFRTADAPESVGI